MISNRHYEFLLLFFLNDFIFTKNLSRKTAHLIFKKNTNKILNTTNDIITATINVLISNDISEKFPIIGLPIIIVPHTTITFSSIFEKNVIKMNFRGLYLYIPNGIKIILSGIGVIPARNIVKPPYFLRIL